MPEKKKRTVLMGPGASPNKKKKYSLRRYLRTRKGGVGGTIGEVKRRDKPPVKIKWGVGAIGTTPGGSKRGRLKKRSRPGFRFEVKF